MEKKTDKSPVEQIEKYRQWLQSNMPKALAKFNELFPEVQQVPIEESAIKFMQEQPLQFIMQMALRKLTKEQFKALQDWCDSYKQLPIKDIDALAESWISNLNESSTDAKGFIHPEVALQTLKKIADIAHKQCLYDRGSDAATLKWSDEDYQSLINHVGKYDWGHRDPISAIKDWYEDCKKRD